MATAFVVFAGGEPAELHGSRLGNHTGLRLVVADRPPFIFAVDSGAVTRLTGVGNAIRVIRVTDGSAILVDDTGATIVNKRLYAVRSGAATASPIGNGRDVVPAAGRAGVWVTRVVRRKHCALLRIGVDGRSRPLARSPAGG